MWLSVELQWLIVIFSATAAAKLPGQSPRQCCSDNAIPVSGNNCSNGVNRNINCTNSSKFVLLQEHSDYQQNDDVLIVENTQYDVQYHIYPDEYCTGFIPGSSNNGALVCMSAIIDEDYHILDRNIYLKLYSYLLLISVVFLMATLFVYCVIPSLRDLQGKCLMCFVACLAVGYFSLAILQQNFFEYDVSSTICTIFGFWTYFWLLSTFFWLSIIAFNIWYQSRFVTGFKERTLWLSYLVIGFGTPLLFQIVAIIFHHIPNSLLRPNIGNGVCWFEDVPETWVYFTGPLAILLLSNLIFFIMTTRILWIHYKEARPQPRIRTLRFKMVLYLKLFLLMGLTWIFELVSFAFRIDWYISDILNSLQGPIIFTVMVLTRKRVARTLTRDNWYLSICYFCTRPWSHQNEDDDSDTEALEDIQLH